jgi:quercetin dioxygenase-like cupin family protein
MTHNVLYPDWREVVVYPAQGAQPHVLVETDQYRSVIAGLAAGSSIPPHPEGPSVFHFLEGSGRMTVGEETFAVQAGATVIVPAGAKRGVEAATRLAFLAVRLSQ